MEGVSVLLVVFTAVLSCNAIVFTPCQLARKLRTQYNAELVKYFEGNLSLALCIAGYHHYNTTYHLKHPDGSRSLGIFGLKYTTRVPECVFFKFDHANDFLGGDLNCLNKTVLVHRKKAYMYERLCASDLTRRITCDVTLECKCTVTESAWVPIHDDIIDITYGEEDSVVKYLSDHNKDYFSMPEQPEVASSHMFLSVTNVITTAIISMIMTVLVFGVYLIYKKFV
ncbi:hypothetical protein GE061_013590 [Apolygus lucorum]|uniref:Uncharacterized protein n=1 Tax=Apolygus lucorum TaxID=248454 RepID=A0A6A4K7B0_APOLU|nr:hypothetical protein GE061_013590 [Apolygus lucorum]